MSRAARAVVLSLALFGCAGTPEPAAPQPHAELPTYEFGEKWIRNDGIYELIRIEDRYAFSSSGGREIQLGRDLVVWESRGGRRSIQFIPPPSLGWPLQVGRRSSRYGPVRADPAGMNLGGNITPETRLTVDAYEDVQVPAGTFKAFRITGAIQEGVVQTPLGGWVFRTWYAPEARQIVKAESRTQRTRATTLDDLFLERLTRAKGRAIITAARPTELSLELSELGHGLFTYYVFDGLRGAADANRDRIVSLQELYEYVEHQVVEKSRAVGANQHPVLKGELEGILPLMKVAP